MSPSMARLHVKERIHMALEAETNGPSLDDFDPRDVQFFFQSVVTEILIQLLLRFPVPQALPFKEIADALGVKSAEITDGTYIRREFNYSKIKSISTFKNYVASAARWLLLEGYLHKMEEGEAFTLSAKGMAVMGISLKIPDTADTSIDDSIPD